MRRGNEAEDSDEGGSFASGLGSGFCWSDGDAAVSFHSDPLLGVAVALYKPHVKAAKPPRAPSATSPAAPLATASAAAANEGSIEAACPSHDVATAEEVALLYSSLANAPSADGDAASSGGDDWHSRTAALTRLRGPFAFVLHDAARNAVLAARDSLGAAPLFWGAAADGALLFATSAAAPGLAACDKPNAAPFPAGCLFLAAGGAHPAEEPGPLGFTLRGACAAFPGQLRSFARAAPVRVIPRISSRGVLCGAVFRVASADNLAGGAQPTAH